MNDSPSSKRINIDAEFRELREIGRCTSYTLERQIEGIIERIESAIRPDETNGNPWPEYTNAVGDAGHQYMQRCDGRISSGFFYWHELWDALNIAAYSSQPAHQSPPGSVPAIGAPTAPVALGSPLEPTPKPEPPTPEPPTQEWIDRSQGLEPEKANEAKSSAEFLERLHTGHPANCPCWDCTRDQLKF